MFIPLRPESDVCCRASPGGSADGSEGGSWFAGTGVCRSVVAVGCGIAGLFGVTVKTDMESLLTDYDLIA